jgi:hypothetical protein
MQKIIIDDKNIIRFKENKIVKYLIENGPLGMAGVDAIAIENNFSTADREQLAQLVGCSISEYGALGYVSDESYHEAEEIAEKFFDVSGLEIAT